jgi:hypothetical protein
VWEICGIRDWKFVNYGVSILGISRCVCVGNLGISPPHLARFRWEFEWILSGFGPSGCVDRRGGIYLLEKKRKGKGKGGGLELNLGFYFAWTMLWKFYLKFSHCISSCF